MALPELRHVKSPNYSSRGGRKVDLVVVHDCEGSFGGSVSWFQQARSRVSAHIVMSEDGTQAVQMVDWANKAWHVCNINSWSEGIEAAGYSHKGLGQPEWLALAEIVAFRLHAHGLPSVRVRGNPHGGFCQHADLGMAGGGHTDITYDTNVMAAFEKMVQDAWSRAGPAQWPLSAKPGLSALPGVPVGWTPSFTRRDDLIEGSLEWVQMQLNAWSQPNVPVLSVDGLDGPNTQRALGTFQQVHKLFITGQAGPETVAALKLIA